MSRPFCARCGIARAAHSKLSDSCEGFVFFLPRDRLAAVSRHLESARVELLAKVMEARTPLQKADANYYAEAIERLWKSIKFDFECSEAVADLEEGK